MLETLGVTATLEENTRIHEALVGASITSELVENPNAEPIAILLKGVLDPSEVRGSVSINHGRKSAGDISTLSDTFPLGGSMLYPSKFLDIVDLAALAAADTNVGLATHLSGNQREDNDFFVEKGKDPLGLHADFPGLGPIEKNMPLHGLNMHYVRRGSVLVTLGIMRELEYDAMISEMEKAIYNKQAALEDLEALYRSFPAPFAEPVELGAGDLLIFQAKQHADRGLVPVAHRFVTTSGIRRSDIFHPQIGNTEAVKAERIALATKYNLAEWGYDTA